MPRRHAFAAALCVPALAAALSLAAGAGAQTHPAPLPPPAAAVSAPTVPYAIPAAEIIARSSEVSALLSATVDRFAPTDEIEKIERSLPELTRQIDLDFTDTSVTLGEQPPLTAIQAEQARWQQRQVHVSTLLGVLTRRAVEIRAAHDHLARTVEIWTLTRDALRSEQAPAAIQQQAAATLAAIEAAQAQLKSMEDAALGLQGGLAAELARCDEALGQIARAQKSAVVGILNRESLPIWSPALWDTARATLPARLLGIARGFGTNILEYVFDPARGLPAHVLVFLVLALGAGAARHRKRRWAQSGIGVSAAVNVFERPFSVALMLTLWSASSAMSPAPARVRDLLVALAILPVIRLVRPMADPRALPIVYGAVLLYLVDFVRRAVGGTLLLEQLLLILESVAAAGAVIWLLRKERLRRIPGQLPAILRSRFAPMVLRVTVVVLAAGALSAALGFTRLARLVTPAVLNGTTLALILFGAVRATRGALAVGLRVPPLNRLRLVSRHCDLLEFWARRLLVWGAIFVWARRFLDYIGLLDPVAWAVNALLEARFERGSISISLEDVLAFGVTIWVSYLVSGLIRFALKEEVYPRRGISRGMSYAYSRLVHYIVLAIGFMVGLGVLGLDLGKISVLAGAFGVGIGFGLQDVVNNFVCGLILLFERPVHAGDIVEVGGLQGEVRRIGIRASTIHTYQGADIVVPNSQFITATVTNWTLSDQLRRIDLPVGVNYGAEPRKVIELLEATARANPSVLAEPPPQCLFTGYGDSSITFELRAWTDRFDTWGGVRSELATAVYDAVYAAGLSFPFPQREVRVVGAAAAAEPAAAADDRAAAPSIVPESRLPQVALEPRK